jgi:hypothetical protein
MTDAAAACRAALEAALAGAPLASALGTLAAAPEAAADRALREFARAHGPAALPVIAALADDPAARGLRRVARRALYRLAQQGVAAPPRPAPRPVVERRAERPARAWLSGIDGTGSRAAWILFEGGFGGAALCSLILNDVVGILEVAGGEITKKRLETELAALRASQKLPWVEVAPPRAVAAVREALALHRTLGTTPPSGFARWQPAFESAPVDATVPPAPAGPPDGALLARTSELLGLPELASWFLDPESVQSESLELLQTRESRLVVSDQIKAEREAAIVERIVEREFSPAVRERWARRLEAMAFVFAATDRPEHAAIAAEAAAALRDPARDVRQQPFPAALARRGMELAGEVAAGRLSAADVSRRP